MVDPKGIRLPEEGLAHAPLACILQAVLRSTGPGGCPGIDDDDLAAALGRPLLCAAVPGDVRLSCWAATGHDAFLVNAARLFGLSLRGIQPPQAAHGLEQAAKYAQHFQASYLPFVLAALSHQQPVLAWSGPPLARGESPGWALITRGCENGAGLAGLTFEAPDPRRAGSVQTLRPREVVFEQPLVQLYVVEECTPVEPAPAKLLELALAHARQSVSGVLDECFGVVTGVAAYDHWIKVIRAADAGSAEPLAPGHAQLAALVVEGARSGERFFARHAESAPTKQRELVQTLAAVCHEIAQALAPGLDATALPSRLANPAGITELIEQLSTARAALSRVIGIFTADSAS